MTLLTQTLAIDNMRRAWDDVADNQGIAGADNITISQWQRNWEERLLQLTRDVRTNQYKPGPLRTRRIPKNTPGEWRTLRIPTLSDRILQRAVLQQLHPIYEPRFLDCSFGYRPGRSLHHAVRHLTQLRKQGYTWILDADIDDFFNQVDHPLLHHFLQQDLLDHSLLPLINRWLTSWQTAPDQPRSLAMGAPLSPLLANVYLHRLDEHLRNYNYPLARYADDFIVLSSNQTDWQRSYQLTADILTQLKLQYEPAKTRLTTFADGFEFLGVHFEETWYWYTWDDKRIEVQEDQPDPWLDVYDPFY